MTSSALPSIDGAHEPGILELTDVEEALLVDCFTPSRGDVATVLGGIVVGEALVFAVLEQAIALHPIATAVALVAATSVGVRTLSGAESSARLGLGAQLVARGVSREVAVEIVAAERRLGWRFHLRPKQERARMLVAEARRGERGAERG